MAEIAREHGTFAMTEEHKKDNKTTTTTPGEVDADGKSACAKLMDKWILAQDMKHIVEVRVLACGKIGAEAQPEYDPTGFLVVRFMYAFETNLLDKMDKLFQGDDLQICHSRFAPTHERYHKGGGQCRQVGTGQHINAECGCEAARVSPTFVVANKAGQVRLVERLLKLLNVDAKPPTPPTKL